MPGALPVIVYASYRSSVGFLSSSLIPYPSLSLPLPLSLGCGVFLFLYFSVSSSLRLFTSFLSFSVFVRD